MRRTLFVGGSRHREWLELDDRLHYVQMPHVEQPRWSPDVDELDIEVRVDLYNLRDLVHVVEHPCVRAAGLATIYRVAMWSKLSPDAALVPIVRDAAGGPHVDRRQIGVPRMDDAPDWWTHPAPPRWVETGRGGASITLPFTVDGL